MRRLPAWLVFLVAIAIILPAPAQEDVHPALLPEPLDDGWTIGSAVAAGFDVNALAALAEDLDQDTYRNIHAVLIARGETLIFEHYLSGTDQIWGTDIGHVSFDRETLHDLRSISKSVTSLVLGIALGDDHAGALDRPILSWFPERADEVDAGFDAITLRHALTMTAGLDWNEMTASYTSGQNDEIRMYDQVDPLAHVLSRPMREAPGERWYYNGGLTMLLAAVVQEITGETFEDYTKQALFDPLGIETYAWSAPEHWPAGLPSAASGLRLTARDLARIGSLVLHEGRWQGEQIVPAPWISMSGERLRDDLGLWNGGGAYGYGFQWWNARFDVDGEPVESISGVGFGGQRIMIVPRYDLVVTVFAGNYFGSGGQTTDRVLQQVIEALTASP